MTERIHKGQIMTKEELRTQMVQRRKALSSQERDEAAENAARQLLLSPAGSGAHLAVYCAVRGELSLNPFLREAFKRGRKLYFPRVQGREMNFYLVEEESQLLPGAFGIREPARSCLPLPDPVHAVYLVPGTAFDPWGGRLGMGGGFYDRYFSSLNERPCHRIGVGYEFQYLKDRIPTETYDIPVTGFVSPSGYQSFSG